MSDLISGFAWLAVGAGLGGWWADARRHWLDALEHADLVPPGAGGTALIRTVWTKPWLVVTRGPGVIRATLSRAARDADDEDVRYWTFRVKRRRMLFVSWALAGAPLVLVNEATLAAIGRGTVYLAFPLILEVVVVGAILLHAVRAEEFAYRRHAARTRALPSVRDGQ